MIKNISFVIIFIIAAGISIGILSAINHITTIHFNNLEGRLELLESECK